MICYMCQCIGHHPDGCLVGRAEKAEAKVAALCGRIAVAEDAEQRNGDRAQRAEAKVATLEARLATTSRCSTPDCPNDAVIGLCGDHALAMTDLEKREAKVGEYEDEILRLEARLAEVMPVVEAAERLSDAAWLYLNSPECGHAGGWALRTELARAAVALRAARAKREGVGP